MKSKLVFSLLLIGTTFFQACDIMDSDSQNSKNGQSEITEKSEESLTEQESTDLYQLRDEEFLAKDIYDYAYEKYQNEIFNNISQSEQSHTDAVLNLLNLYEIEDPAANHQAGVYDNEELQAIYDQLVAQVDISEQDALHVGATIEDLDIYDIELLESHTENKDLLNVYSKLKCGSRNHMRSFTSSLESNYLAQFLTQENIDEIVNSEKEKCGN